MRVERSCVCCSLLGARALFRFDPTDSLQPLTFVVHVVHRQPFYRVCVLACVGACVRAYVLADDRRSSFVSHRDGMLVGCVPQRRMVNNYSSSLDGSSSSSSFVGTSVQQGHAHQIDPEGQLPSGTEADERDAVKRAA